MFSDKLNKAPEGYTFDDFLLVPCISNIEPKDVGTKSRVSRNYSLNIPVVSSAMDTVTEANMAIALAQEGGLGVIHRNMTIKEQLAEVEKVKRSEELTIRDVITTSPDTSIHEASIMMDMEDVSGLPVVDNGQVIGIISRRDIKPIINSDAEKKVREFMTEEVVTITESATPEEALDIAYDNKVERLPIVRNNRIVGIVTIRDILERKKHPHAARDSDGRFLVAAATGPFDLERAIALDKAGADIIAMDVAHAHKPDIIKSAKKMKENIQADLLVGNIATGEAAEAIIAGADIDGFKVGIGPGSICTTRIIAGVGVPQLTAISSVADVAHEHGVPVIGDGGLRYSGDVAKAIAVGADAVMVGSLLAGTTESPGDVVIMNGRKFKQYRGMGSLGAMTGGSGAGTDRYFQEVKGPMKHAKLVPEGVEGVVPFKGPVNEVIFQLMGGLKASMGYSGAANIKEMWEKAKFVRITSSGMTESHPHDLLITNESPNYPTTRLM
ncbi:IMP dehydrogenase [Methanobacterium formicicum]|uniref:Inosine-5'-monophosphate dehydrogenase n=1 Tax=Methanobacterium formicicum (strain DSM 3637 / PP1) TaxID=1204725 RepID=K2R5I3_METFP|nr:IMP dehydrogenase [Methanobacterium formicicum]EKF86477.1 inosine-5'-monophosphate dehydrogenase [Methanobacterium formicicum DSM 3637]